VADNEGNYNLKIYLFKSKNNQKQGWMLSKILEIVNSSNLPTSRLSENNKNCFYSVTVNVISSLL